MSQNFFNPYDLVRKGNKEDKHTLLAALKKAQPRAEPKLAADRRGPQPMDLELPRPAPGLGPQAQQAARKLTRAAKAFLARRRVFNRSLADLKKKIADIELLLVKLPDMRKKQFLMHAKLVELIRVTKLAWISASKFLQDGGFKAKQLNAIALRTNLLTLIFKLSDLIVMNFDRKTGKQSLLMYLLQDQSSNIILFISVLSFLKVLKRLDTNLDFIQNSIWKRSVAQFYHTLFDTEDFLLNGRFFTLQESSLDMAKDLITEVVEGMGIHKTIALSMYSYLKVNTTDSSQLVKPYILGCFFGHFLSRAILKSDSSFLSPQAVHNALTYSFECCFGCPLVGQFFRTDVLQDPKIGQVFMDLLEKMPTQSLKQTNPVTFDSKLNTVFNALYLLGKFLSDSELPSEATLRSLLELLDLNIQDYISKNLFTMILNSFAGDPSYNFITTTIGLMYTPATIQRSFQLILDSSFEKETKSLNSKLLVFMIHMANITGNGTVSSTGIIGVASNHSFMQQLFKGITKNMHLASRDSSFFDTADLNIDMDIPSFSLYLEAFHKFLITSEFSWQQTEKIMDKRSLPNFVVFLKNVLLSTYIQNYLTGASSAVFQFTFTNGAEILSLLYEINEESKFIEPNFFRARPDQLDILQNTMALIPEMDDVQIDKQIEVVKKLPFCYPFELKYYLLTQIVNSLKARNMNYSEIEIKIRREYLVLDTVHHLKKLKGNQALLRGKIKICFMDELGTYESGIDTGGILKEFLYEAAKRMLDPAYGLFIEMKDRELDPNPESKAIFGPEHLFHYYVAGVVIGRAIYEEILIDSVFSKIMLRRMLGKPNFFNHLALYDTELFEQLKKVKNYQGDAADLGLTFSTNTKNSDEEIELMKGGSNVPVTNENKIRYIYYLTHYYLNAKTREQSKAFLGGMSDIIPLSILQMFTTQELQIIISGVDAEINISDWAAHTNYSGGFSASDPYVKSFWKMVSEFDTEDKVKLLKFVTNCRRAPVFGFKNLQPPFALQKLEEAGQGSEARLPIAAVCFNTLKLPIYSSPELMRQKLIQAINSGSGYYII